MKFTSWREARTAAAALFGWLGSHCPSCGKRHTRACLSGGRCVHCMRSLCTVATLAEAVSDSESRLFPKTAEPLVRLPHYVRDVSAIVADKANGKDCTQAESAEVKAMLETLRKLFPLEWDEANIGS